MRSPGGCPETRCAPDAFHYPASVNSHVTRGIRHSIALAALCLGTYFSTSASAAAGPAPTLVIPLRIHLLQSSNEPAVHTTLSESDIRRIIGKVNGIWAPAGIRFEIESIVAETARIAGPPERALKVRWPLAVTPPETRASNAFNVYYVKRMQPNGYWAGGVAFVKDTASLRAVEGGIDEPLPRVTAHELGHALGLPHRQDVTNLMASGTTGTALNEQEINTTRTKAAGRTWVREEKNAPGKPDASSGKECR
jgi:Matrixin